MSHREADSASVVRRWIHALKWQCIMLPNGMMPYPFGPICGSNHDGHMLRLSNLLPALDDIMAELGYVYSLYGDLAYPNTPTLMRPIAFAQVGSPEELLNQVMSSVRISVEWGFGRLASLWPWLDYTRGMQVLLAPIGLYFPVAVVLTNAYTTLYGSQTGDYFGVLPPSLEEYVSGAML